MAAEVILILARAHKQAQLTFTITAIITTTVIVMVGADMVMAAIIMAWAICLAGILTTLIVGHFGILIAGSGMVIHRRLWLWSMVCSNLLK